MLHFLTQIMICLNHGVSIQVNKQRIGGEDKSVLKTKKLGF